MAAELRDRPGAADDQPAAPARTASVERIVLRSLMLVGAAVAAVWLIIALHDLLLVLFVASVAAVALRPVVDWLDRHMPRALAILLIYALLLGVLALVLGLLVPVLVAELQQLRAVAPGWMRQIGGAPPAWLARDLTPLEPAAGDAITRAVSGQAGTLVTALGRALASAASLVSSLGERAVLVVVFTFFLLADRLVVARLIDRLLPPAQRPAATLLAQQIGWRLGRWVRGQLLIGLFCGISFGLGLRLLGVPYALSLGSAAAVLELVPYLGGAVVTTIAALLALTISPWLVLGVLLLEALIALIEGHVLYAAFVGGRVGLHPVLILLALLVGGHLQGLIGVFVAVPMLIVLGSLFDQLPRFDQSGPAARD